MKGTKGNVSVPGSRVPRASPPRQPPVVGRDSTREAAVLNALRLQGAAAPVPGQAATPPTGDGASTPLDTGVTRSVIPAGAGSKNGMGSGFSWSGGPTKGEG